MTGLEKQTGRLQRRPRTLAAAIAVALLVTVLAAGAVAGITLAKSGKAVTAVKTVTDDISQLITVTSWTDINSESTVLTVPSNTKALLVITFSASANCHDLGARTNFCYVQALVNGNAAAPGAVVFGSAADGNSGSNYQASSMTWVYGPVSAGQYSVDIQGKIGTSNSTFALAGRSLVVLRSKV